MSGTVLERMEAREQATGLPWHAGISNVDCPIECNVDCCVITGKAHCGHPKKGALSPLDQMNPDIVERRREAMRQLKIAEVQRDRGD